MTAVLILLMLPGSMLANEHFHVPVMTTVLLLAGLAAFVVVYLRRLPARLHSDADPGELPTWSTLAFVLLSTATAGLAVVSIHIGWIWLTLPAYAVTDLLLSGSPAPWRVLTPTAVAVGAAAGIAAVLGRPEDGWVTGLVGGIATTVVTLGVAGYEATQLRLWRSAVELEAARRDADSVATMRERLRLAEDLHDILGHALESVALKSELAARLSATEPDRAGTEMVEVQHLARQTMRDFRDVVHRGNRADLVVELAGVRDLFGRVVREAVTNALRHADLTRCDITPTAAPRPPASPATTAGSERSPSEILRLQIAGLSQKPVAR